MSQGIDADRGGRLRLTPHGLRPFAIMMRPVFGLVILVVGALLVDSTLTSPARAGGVTFEVTQAENAIEQGDGTCDGTCTLREAILAANASPGHDTIVFAPEVFTEDDGANIITPNPLPNVDASEGITIDGTGAVVELFGFELETAGNGLTFTSGVGELVNDVVVRDLFISHFTLGIYMCPGMNENECTSSASNILIEDVTVTESYGEGIGIDATGVTSTMLVGVHATDNGGQGASVSSEGNAEGVSILDSTFSGNMAQGAQIRAFNGLVIDALVQGNTFTNNTSGQSLYITSEASEGVEVAENTVTGPGQGIYMSGSGSDFHVHDNSVQPGTQGIVIFGPGGPDFRITDNQVTGGSGDGIVFSVQSPGTGIELAGNVIMEGGSRAGIFLSSVMPPGSPFLVRNNTVSDRGGDAIHVTGAANATITRNETYNNGQLGIDLNPDPDVNPVPGVTLNDPGDADTGPNGLLNFPEIGVDDGQSVTGTACPECTVELFLSDADPSGYGEGKLFLRDAEANGSGDFSVAICSLVLVPGDKVTATSTDPNGMTSEFSLNHTLTEPAGLCATATPSPTPIATPTPTSEPEPTPTPTAVPTATPTPTVTGSPPGPAQGDVDCDGDVDSVDALKQLRHVASLDVQQEPECPAIGSVALFGDVDCDEDVDSVDALFVLRHVAGLPVNVPKECPAIGT